ncbi:hypothetical protein H1R20_g13831, partial [Candolleomyces eurysporus]
MSLTKKGFSSTTEPSDANNIQYSEPYYLEEPVKYTEKFSNSNPSVNVDIFSDLCALLATLSMRSQPILGFLYLGESKTPRIGGAAGKLIEQLAKYIIGHGRSHFAFVSVSWLDRGVKDTVLFNNEAKIRSWLDQLFREAVSSPEAESSQHQNLQVLRLTRNSGSAANVILTFLSDPASISSKPLLQVQLPDKAQLSETSIGSEFNSKLGNVLRNLCDDLEEDDEGEDLLPEHLDTVFQHHSGFLELHSYDKVEKSSEWEAVKTAVANIVKSASFILKTFNLQLLGITYCWPDSCPRIKAEIHCNLRLLSKICGVSCLGYLVLLKSTWRLEDKNAGILQKLVQGANFLAKNRQTDTALKAAITGVLLKQNQADFDLKSKLALCQEIAANNSISGTSTGLEILEFLTTELAKKEEDLKVYDLPESDAKSLNHIWHSQITMLFLQWGVIRFSGSASIYQNIEAELQQNANVQKAITQMEAIVTLQSQHHPEKGNKLAQLGGLYSAHFVAHGDTQDLSHTIKRYNEAVALFDPDDPQRAEHLLVLGSHLEKRCQLSGNKDDLVKAIYRCQEAVDVLVKNLGPSIPNDLKKAFASHALGAILKRKFENDMDNVGAEADVNDINRAILRLHDAEGLAPRGHQITSIIFSDLCHSHVLKSKYYSYKKRDQQAVSMIETAMDEYNKTLPEPGSNHPAYAMILNAKCQAYSKHYKLVKVKNVASKYAVDIQEAIRVDHMIRFKSARNWARVETEMAAIANLKPSESITVLKAYEYCVILLAEIAGEEIPLYEQYRRLEKIQKIVHQATAAAVSYDKLDKAVEFFEEGRSVIWKHYFKHDTIMHALKGKDPKLAKDYINHRNQLRSNAADEANSTLKVRATLVDGAPNSQGPKSNLIVKGLKKIKKAIQEFAEFSTFGLYQKLSLLDKAAEHGPIILINLCEEQCDALILQKKRPVTHVKLPKMTYAFATELQNNLTDVIGEGGRKYTTVLIDEEGTVESVKRELFKSQWAHFACHGVQNEVDGLKSALLLDGGEELTLKELVGLGIPQAEFAFLSACQSAKGDIALPEEHIHLAAGMLTAGYRGVIATMWSIRDEDGLYVAKEVYNILFEGEKKKGFMDHKKAVRALNEAIKKLREEKNVNCRHWVPFVHIGL